MTTTTTSLRVEGVPTSVLAKGAAAKVLKNFEDHGYDVLVRQEPGFTFSNYCTFYIFGQKAFPEAEFGVTVKARLRMVRDGKSNVLDNMARRGSTAFYGTVTAVDLNSGCDPDDMGSGNPRHIGHDRFYGGDYTFLDFERVAAEIAEGIEDEARQRAEVAQGAVTAEALKAYAQRLYDQRYDDFLEKSGSPTSAVSYAESSVMSLISLFDPDTAAVALRGAPNRQATIARNRPGLPVGVPADRDGVLAWLGKKQDPEALARSEAFVPADTPRATWTNNAYDGVVEDSARLVVDNVYYGGATGAKMVAAIEVQTAKNGQRSGNLHSFTEEGAEAMIAALQGQLRVLRQYRARETA